MCRRDLHNLISVQRPRSTRSLSVVTLARPPDIILSKNRRRRRRKIRAQAWSLFARLFNNQRLQYNSSKQFLINFTSTSSSLNFGTIIINNFLIRPEFIQSGFKCVSRFCMHNVIWQTVPHINNSII